MDVFLSILLMLVLLASYVWYIFYAPDWLTDLVGKLFYWSVHLLHDLTMFSITLVNISVHLAHWIGRILVVLIFLGASITLTDSVLLIFDFEFLDHEGLLFKLTRLLEDKITWVASTAVVATTVALGHFKTIDFNYDKHKQEVREKRNK